MSNPFASQIAQLEEKIQATQVLLDDPQLAELARAELTELEAQKQSLEDAYHQMNQHTTQSEMTADPRKGNCVIEIRQGAGGDEAKIWATDILRMYTRFTETNHLKVTYIDEYIIKITGSYINATTQKRLSPYEFFQYESGVHRVQRVPVTEAQGRIHTSTASVAVLPEVPVNAVEIREEDLEWQFMRSSGAGGQSVNKTSSACRLIHLPTGIAVTARQEKKQEQNRKIALELLRSQLWEIEEEKRQKELGEARSVIGRAQRAEKIRTYNFPQSRITDHRTKQSWYNLFEVLEGNIEKMILEVREALTNPLEKIILDDQEEEPLE